MQFEPRSETDELDLDIFVSDTAAAAPATDTFDLPKQPSGFFLFAFNVTSLVFMSRCR